MIELGATLLGILLIAYYFYKWVTINSEYFKKRRLPHLHPYFFFGNTGAFLLKKYRLYDYHEYLYNAFPAEKIFGMFDFRKPFLYIRDPEMAKKLAVKDFDHFEDHQLLFDNSVDKLFGNSLAMLHGEKWRDMRATLSPAFTGSKMRQMFELVVECAIIMSNHLVKRGNTCERFSCDMKDLFSRYTNDVIASTAFGVKLDSFVNRNNEFWETGNNLLKFTSTKKLLKLLFLKLTPAIMKLLDIEFIDKKDSTFIRNMVTENMKIREKQGIFRPDMINILMQVRKGNLHQQDEESVVDCFAVVQESNLGRKQVRREWSNDELIAQCFIFFAAGFDTSSTIITFLSYELALNLDVQQKLYEEIVNTNKILNGKQLQYDILQKMKYMDMVISEALRMWPPGAVTDRVCVKDYVYDDGDTRLIIEKNTKIWIPIFSFQNDPNYFPNPRVFDPERFSDDNKGNIIPGTYLPFGIGPRNCIGSRFALMEVKAVIYYLLLHFKLVTNDKTEIPVKVAKTPITLFAENGIHLDLVLRK